jgi:hypothetical protein
MRENEKSRKGANTEKTSKQGTTTPRGMEGSWDRTLGAISSVEEAAGRKFVLGEDTVFA